MARLVLTIEIPDDITDADLMEMQGVRSTITADGIPEDVHTWLILAAAEAYERDTRRRHLEEVSPLLSSEVVSVLVDRGTRLSLVDTLMHLPMLASDGVITPI